MSGHDDIDDDNLQRLVNAFYTKVRADPELGPIFNDAVDDWPEHLEKLGAFWSSVMLRSGRYKGNPMAAHVRQRSRLSPALFERWLELWAETTQELMSSDAADALRDRAGRIAESLQYALRFIPLPERRAP